MWPFNRRQRVSPEHEAYAAIVCLLRRVDPECGLVCDPVESLAKLIEERDFLADLVANGSRIRGLES